MNAKYNTSSNPERSPPHQPAEPPTPKKGGRLNNTSINEMKNQSVCLISAKNEVATLYAAEKERVGRKGKRMKKGRLQEIVEDVKNKQKLPCDFVVDYNVVKKRIQRKSIVVVNKGQGVVSPLIDIEPHFVDVILKMAQIGKSLTPTQCLTLMNDLIKGTEYQDRLVK